MKVDREEAIIQAQIQPKPKQGSLHKPFKLPLVASMDLIDARAT